MSVCVSVASTGSVDIRLGRYGVYVCVVCVCYVCVCMCARQREKAGA